MATATRCPVVEDFDPLSDAFPHDDPYPLFAQLRADHPVFYAPAVDLYVVTRYEDIEDIFRTSDGQRFSANNASSPVCPMSKEATRILDEGGYRRVPTLNNADPPRHPPMRSGVRACMSPRRLRLLEPMIRAKATELVDAMAAQPVADLVADLAFPLPAFAGLGLLGFPEEDFEQVKQWTGNRVLLTYGRPNADQQERSARDVVAFWQYVERFIDQRVAEPADDFTSDMIRRHREDPEAPDLEDLVNIVYSIAFAGHETTTNAIANAMVQLLRRRDQWDALCADPSQIDRATEEALRFDAPVMGWRRKAVVDTEVGGVPIPAGAHLLMLFASAHHDPAKFADPERFDITRQNAPEHVTFGKGQHYCLGAPLARIEMRIVLELLTEHAPHMTLADAELDYPANVALRGPRRLLVHPSGQ